VDMPADPAYLYDRALPWPWQVPGPKVHGHLNEDIEKYILRLAGLAEDHGARLQFFLEGNTMEDPPDLWIEILKRGHAVDQHTYDHISLVNTPLDEIRRQLTLTKDLLAERLNTDNIGLRGPGGYAMGLHGRQDVQQVIVEAGIKYASTQDAYKPSKNPAFQPPTDERTIEMLGDLQPCYYPTGLLEIPFCCWQDRSFFDVDVGGDPTRPVDDWIAYLKRAVDFVYDRGLFLTLTVHPSTGFKHDPEARYLGQLLSYCREKPGTIVCTYRDIFRWVERDG